MASIVPVRKMSNVSTDATSNHHVRPKSLKYKEETRDIIKRISLVAYKIKRTPDLYVKEVVGFIGQFKEVRSLLNI